MVQESKIEWCTHTSNPVKYRDADGRVVWACVKKSSGCANCYAETLAQRYGRGGPFTKPVMAGLSPFVDEKELRELLSPRKLPAGSKCFVGDMTDVFGEWVAFEELDRLFAVFALRPDVVFQVLTKRPERMREYLTAQLHGDRHLIDAVGALKPEWSLGQREGFVSRAFGDDEAHTPVTKTGLPLPNVWLGTSVEDQAAADERIPELLATPAAVRFLSCEPLLGPVELDLDICEGCDAGDGLGHKTPIRWVITGGESGPGARSMDLAWMRGVVEQCQAAKVPVFVKQLGATAKDGEWELMMHSQKGGDMGEWPKDLRVREWPDA